MQALKDMNIVEKFNHVGFDYKNLLIDFYFVLHNNKPLDVAILYKEGDCFVVNFLDYNEVRFLSLNDMRGIRYKYMSKNLEEVKILFRKDCKKYEENL